MLPAATTIQAMSALLVYLLLGQIFQMLTQLARNGDVPLVTCRVSSLLSPPRCVAPPAWQRSTFDWN
jgi:hypothetical protein